VSNPAKQKGTAFETAVVTYLHERGFLAAHRPAVAGSYDSGDINGIVKRSKHHEPVRQAIIQCKNQKTFKLSEWMTATKEQATQKKVCTPISYGADQKVSAVPLLAVKRPGVGAKNLGKTYVVMELDDMIALLKEAGYQ